MRKSNLAKAKEMVKGARERHADAVWKIERAWAKVPKHEYALRKELVDAALDLSSMNKTIDEITKKYKL